MNKEKVKRFVKEFKALQDKYGIHIAPTYEEEIDYDWNEEPYVSGVQSYLLLVDEDGNTLNFDEVLEEDFTCLYCGNETCGDGDFCSATCKKAYKG
jgi:hypothetical protein